MKLVTLGELALEPSSLTRPKPLFLLSYLSLEGPRSRRDVAELFWQSSKDPMQGLRMALLQINKEAPGAIQSDDKKVWTDLKTDVAELRALFASKAPHNGSKMIGSKMIGL
jgi:DNA-binding SARP family transcriptional activator